MLRCGTLGRLAYANMAIVVLCVFVGCSGTNSGPDLGAPVSVKGKVTMDGAPAANVDVIFNRTEGGVPPAYRQFVASTDVNGEYQIPKIYASTYQVMIKDPVEAKAQEAQMTAVDTGKYSKYGLASPLTAKVDANSVEFPFELTSK